MTTLREAVRLAPALAPAEHAHATLLAARVLGIWGYHESVIAICRDALAGDLDPAVRGSLEAELFQSCFSGGETAAQARAGRAAGRPTRRWPGGSTARWWPR